MPGSVLIISERALPERGGVAVATSRLAGQAARRGEHVELVSFAREVPPGARHVREEGGLVHHRVGLLADEEESLRALADHARDAAEQAKVDLVHGIYASRAGFVAALVASFLDRPSVVSVRGNDVDRGLFRSADLPRLELALSRATEATAVSRELAKKSAALAGRGVHFIPNAVDCAAFKPEARDNSLVASLGLGDDPVIGFVGELREKKGMRFLLPAFAELVTRRPVRLLVIGGFRADARPAEEAFARSAPEAAARMHVVPYTRSAKRLSRLLSLCDLVVFPALFEGMPNALLEAMAVGRPLLATDAGGHRDVIRHGDNGALLSLADLDALPDAIEELLDWPSEERQRLGRAARDWVAEHHRPDQESEAYGRVYAAARSSRPA
jgi:glycosyltransferase involved in cell wall biosynthesis